LVKYRYKLSMTAYARGKISWHKALPVVKTIYTYGFHELFLNYYISTYSLLNILKRTKQITYRESVSLCILRSVLLLFNSALSTVIRYLFNLYQCYIRIKSNNQYMHEHLLPLVFHHSILLLYIVWPFTCLHLVLSMT
jgi:hypothetical protein